MTISPVAAFDRAAAGYDAAASMQVQVADYLVARAADKTAPRNILDLGCGTGLVTKAAARQWPGAQLTALDASAAMLAQAKRHMPELKIIESDAAAIELPQRYDMIFSSMMLHWLPDPLAALQRWRGWLTPQGRLHVALLVAGSFSEWQNLCEQHRLAPGLWKFPPPDFAVSLDPVTEQQNLKITYDNAHDFLRRLKKTGAAAPHPGHRPLSAAALRRLLAAAPRPFIVRCRVLYLAIKA